MRYLLNFIAALACFSGTLISEDPQRPPVPAPAVNPLITRIAFGYGSNEKDQVLIRRTVL